LERENNGGKALVKKGPHLLSKNVQRAGGGRFKPGIPRGALGFMGKLVKSQALWSSGKEGKTGFFLSASEGSGEKKEGGCLMKKAARQGKRGCTGME